MKKTIFLCVLVFLLPVIYAQGDLLRDETKAILANTRLTPEERLVEFDAFYLEYEATTGFKEDDVSLFYEIIFPYVDKEVKDPVRRNYWRAVYHLSVYWIYNGYENFEKEGEEILKALNAVEKSGDDIWRASIYSQYGRHLVQIGDIKKGHEYMYKAASFFDETGDYDRAIYCLWNIAINFQEIRDAEGLKRIINQMELYPTEKISVQSQYQINSLKSAYYDIALDVDPDNELFKDSSLVFSEQNIYLIENHLTEFSHLLLFTWDYHNHALSYRKKHPEDYDSILYYLNKALEVAPEQSLHKKEIEISVYISFAEINFEQGNYEQAEKDMLYALSLLEELKDYSNTIAEFHEIYKFFVMFYEKMNKPAEALKYQKLLYENAEKRYDNDKLDAINDMSIKYEVEKKEAQIKFLELKNETARKTNILIFSLLLLLIIAIIFIVISNRLRKKNLEQSIYEAALLNELQQAELEKTEDEKQLLQQEYDKVSELAGENKKQAEEYATQLQSIKHQLELKPTQSMAQKIQEMVSQSLIDNYHKQEYIKNLSNLDIDMLEQGYLSANEKITNMDMKYIICFAADMEVKDVSLIFNVEPASVRTVRYRIKKKFQEKNTFKFLI